MKLTRKHVSGLLKTVVAIVVVWYLIYSGRLSWKMVSELFRLNCIPVLLLSALAFIASQCLASYRLVLLLRMIDQK